jgi:hypothetical protein
MVVTMAIKPVMDDAMQTYFPLQQQSYFPLQQQSSKRRQNRLKRLVSAAVGLLAAGGMSLVFGFAMGSQDARWAEPWTGLGHAYSLFG